MNVFHETAVSLYLCAVAQIASALHEQQATLLIDSRGSLLDPCVDNTPCLLSEC